MKQSQRLQFYQRISKACRTELMHFGIGTLFISVRRGTLKLNNERGVV